MAGLLFATPTAIGLVLAANGKHVVYPLVSARTRVGREIDSSTLAILVIAVEGVATKRPRQHGWAGPP